MARGWLVLLLTSLAVAVYFPSQYADGTLETLAHRGTGLASTFAGRPAAVRLSFYVHLASAGLALFVGGFQFSAALRRYRCVHRWIGRTYVSAVLLQGWCWRALAPRRSSDSSASAPWPSHGP